MRAHSSGLAQRVRAASAASCLEPWPSALVAVSVAVIADGVLMGDHRTTFLMQEVMPPSGRLLLHGERCLTNSGAVGVGWFSAHNRPGGLRRCPWRRLAHRDRR
jgi:hypothetical protein